jgi:MFS family permease
MLTRALAVLLSLQVLSGVLVAPLFALFPVYVEGHLGLSPVFSGNIRIAFVVMSGVMAFAGGALCDRMGRKPAFLLGMTGVTASGFLFILPDAWVMYPLALYAGLMFGLGSVAGQSYLIEAAPRTALALATACFFTSGTIGNALGSAVSGWIANEVPEGYALLGWVMAVGHLALLLAAWRLLPAIGAGAAEDTGTPAAGLGELARRPEVRWLLGLRFLPTVYWGAVTLLMPLALFRLTGSEKPPGYYTSASLVVSAVCQLGMGRIVDRFGARVPLMAAIVVLTGAVLGQGLLAHSAPGLIVFGLLGAGAAWSVSVSMTTLVRQLSTEAARSRLLGMTHVAWSAGFLGGTALASNLARDPGGVGPAFLLCGACCAGAVVCTGAVLRFLREAEKSPDPNRSDEASGSTCG